MDSPVSRTCSRRRWTSECGRSGSGLLGLPSLTLGRLGFSHFDARKNGKSNYNKIALEMNHLVLIIVNTNMHKNKVYIPLALSVKELEKKL